MHIFSCVSEAAVVFTKKHTEIVNVCWDTGCSFLFIYLFFERRHLCL